MPTCNCWGQNTFSRLCFEPPHLQTAHRHSSQVNKYRGFWVWKNSDTVILTSYSWKIWQPQHLCTWWMHAERANAFVWKFLESSIFRESLSNQGGFDIQGNIYPLMSFLEDASFESGTVLEPDALVEGYRRNRVKFHRNFDINKVLVSVVVCLVFRSGFIF